MFEESASRATTSCSWVDGHLRVQPESLRLLDNTSPIREAHHPSAIGQHRVCSTFIRATGRTSAIAAFFEATSTHRRAAAIQLFRTVQAIRSSPPGFLPASKINGARSITPSFPTAASSPAPASPTASSVFAASSGKAATSTACSSWATTTTNPRSPFSRTATPAARPSASTGHSDQNAIIDKNARIGANCVLTPEGKPDHVDHALYYIRDGILGRAQEWRDPRRHPRLTGARRRNRKHPSLLPTRTRTPRPSRHASALPEPPSPQPSPVRRERGASRGRGPRRGRSTRFAGSTRELVRRILSTLATFLALALALAPVQATAAVPPIRCPIFSSATSTPPRRARPGGFATRLPPPDLGLLLRCRRLRLLP